MAAGYFVQEKHTSDDVTAARDEAISYAAYRVLEHRYLNAVGGTDSVLEFDQLMKDLCYPIGFRRPRATRRRRLGNRIAAAVIAYGLDDGSNEADGYASRTTSRSTRRSSSTGAGAISMTDPNRWQPLQLELMISQNGIPIEDGVQQSIGPHWGHVAGLRAPDGGWRRGSPIDPGPPPQLGDPASDQAFKDAGGRGHPAQQPARPGPSETIDISPGACGANPLGTNDGDRAPGQSGHGPAVRAERRQRGRLRAGR